MLIEMFFSGMMSKGTRNLPNLEKKNKNGAPEMNPFKGPHPATATPCACKAAPGSGLGWLFPAVGPRDFRSLLDPCAGARTHRRTSMLIDVCLMGPRNRLVDKPGPLSSPFRLLRSGSNMLEILVIDHIAAKCTQTRNQNCSHPCGVVL